MFIRIFGLLMFMTGAFLVGSTLLTGAVPTTIFLWVMAGLVLAISGTVLTSDSFHQESESESEVNEPQRIIIDAPTPAQHQAAKELYDATQHHIKSIDQFKKMQEKKEDS